MQMTLDTVDTLNDQKQLPAKVTPDEKPKVKRKRRSPEKPWKKPKDMPKRPLSAYNLFFRDERERLLKSVNKSTSKDDEGAPTKGKKGKKRSGIGFANLATTIAGRWKELDDDVKAPYEKIAAEEKKRYDTAVAEWRTKQAIKKKAAKKEAEEHRRKMREQQTNPGMLSSERSLGSFSEGSHGGYADGWFRHQNISESDPSERDGSVMVPPVVETSPGSYDHRAYDAAAWPAATMGHDNPYAYYGYTTEPYMRTSPELPRGTYMNRGLFAPPDSRAPQYTGYDYYRMDPTYGQHVAHGASSRNNRDMRMPRASSLPMQYHDFHQLAASPSSHTRQTRNEYGRRAAVSHPRSASMPLMQQSPRAVAAIETPDRNTGEEPTVTAAEIAAEAFRGSDSGSFQQPLEPVRGRDANGEAPPAIGTSNTIDESSIVGTSLQSLTETLDDDAISFITSMKYN